MESSEDSLIDGSDFGIGVEDKPSSLEDPNSNKKDPDFSKPKRPEEGGGQRTDEHRKGRSSGVGAKKKALSKKEMVSKDDDLKVKMLAILILALFITLSLVIMVSYMNENNDGDEKENLSDYDIAIKLGGEWYLNNQDNSFLHYEYYPFEKEHSEAHHSLREIGALWSIAVLANYLDDP